MKHKLKSTRGESIAESLISILVVALASIMFAGMVTASRQVIDQSTEWIEKYYAAVSAINRQQPLGDRVIRNDEENVTINITIEVDGNPITESVTAFINNDLGANIVSYIKK